MQVLLKHGFNVHFVTSRDFKDPFEYATIENVQVWKVLPFNNPKKIFEVAEPILNNMDFVFTHDIVYLNSYLDHEKTLRQIADKHVKIKWFHWSHSAPNPRDKHKPFPNSTYIGMNYTDLPLLAKQHGVPVAKCRVVYNPVDPAVFFNWHPFTKQLVQKHSLLDCDVLAVYPLDTGRFEAKGGSNIIKLIEKMREKGKNAKVIFVNAAANTKQRTKLVKSLKNDHVIFTSLEDPQYLVVTPRRVVQELMQIANIFPLLSTSEGCSLTLLEASLSKNLIILNEDFPPMREFGGIDHALYMKVSSTRCTTSYGDKEKYYTDWANNIIAELENNKMNKMNRMALKQFNPEWIFKEQLEPLLQ